MSFVAPAFSIIGALVQRKSATATTATISYTMSSDELSAPSNVQQTLDSGDPTILGRPSRDAINITAAQCENANNKSHPSIIDTATSFRYREHSFFNNGPARCVYVGLVNTTTLCPVFVSGYRTSAPTGSLVVSSNYLGDAGSSTSHMVARFWVPENSRVVVRVQQISDISSACTTNYILTAPRLETQASAVPACTLDIDGDGSYSATTDGLLLARAMMGLSGNSVISGALGVGATRNTWLEIRDFLRDACFLRGLSD